ncbi:MAG: hypothetical protein IPG70_08290 [Moraxellaceae bacterium]|nr:hypothetical protein [Moraxellaceae bacterium]
MKRPENQRLNSRNLMLEFLRVSGISDEQCGGILDCEFSNTKPSVTNIKLSYLSPYIQNGVQEHKSVWSFSASNGLKSSMLGVNFKGLDCDMMPDKSEFVCPDRPSYTGEGKLRIFQKVNPEVALYEVDNFTANPKIIIEQYASSNLTGVVKICNNCKQLDITRSYESRMKLIGVIVQLKHLR